MSSFSNFQSSSNVSWDCFSFFATPSSFNENSYAFVAVMFAAEGVFPFLVSLFRLLLVHSHDIDHEDGDGEGHEDGQNHVLVVHMLHP